jgi:hypothetical protein
MDRTLAGLGTTRERGQAARRRVPMLCIALASLAALIVGRSTSGRAQAAEGPAERPLTEVEFTEDFEITGRGDDAHWDRADWITLQRRPGGSHPYRTQVKLLYSETGLYVLMEASDAQLTASFDADFEDLWTEDVFEVFLWTDEQHPLYFEYEISPLGKELPILIPNIGGQFLGWRPWHYDGPRRTRKGVSIVDGDAISGARIGGWRAEVFVPYELLRPLQNVPPRPGTTWRANFYRVDHDGGQPTAWDWARVGDSFHEYQKFGTLRFK